MEDIDGVHHINIYSKGKTEVGRWLSNFTYSPIEQFEDAICKALDLKLKTNPRWVAEQVTLPLKHYYEYGGKRIEKEEYNWITEHIQNRVNQLRKYYRL